ncbi:HIRAN domain-containing protein [Blastomonas fulva]|uniref:HIRAN domain-containing protein n=1 Tax=Blastomonas fulva TaxID=1550728 RepID=UPI003F70D922
MNNIHFANEPNRLKLIWQSGGDNRKKLVVGELVRSAHQVSFSYLRHTPDFNEAWAIGFRGHPAFRIDLPVHHHNVMEVLNKRLPPRNRPDFASYLLKHRLSYVPHISDFALLGYTNGYLPGDGFSFAIDFAFENLPHMFLLEISGFRYYSGMQIEIGDLINQQIFFLPEPSNLHDSNAVQVIFAGMNIGYVPRYYLPMMNIWLRYYNVSASIERIDGSMEKPQVYLMVQITSTQTAQLSR